MSSKSTPTGSTGPTFSSIEAGGTSEPVNMNSTPTTPPKATSKTTEAKAAATETSKTQQQFEQTQEEVKKPYEAPTSFFFHSITPTVKMIDGVMVECKDFETFTDKELKTLFWFCLALVAVVFTGVLYAGGMAAVVLSGGATWALFAVLGGYVAFLCFSEWLAEHLIHPSVIALMKGYCWTHMKIKSFFSKKGKEITPTEAAPVAA